MKLKILENNERTFSLYSDLLNSLYDNSDIIVETPNNQNRNVGSHKVTLLTKSAILKFFGFIKNLFSFSFVEMDYKDGDREFHLKAKGKDLNPEEIVGYITNNSSSFVSETINTDKLEKPFTVELKIDK